MAEPKFRVEWIGEERNPVIVIDDFAPDPESMRAAAAHLDFVPFHDQYYPGRRAVAPAQYFEVIGGAIADPLREFFGCHTVRLQQAYYSLATTPREALSQVQRLPHYDTIYENYYAAVHFLCPAAFGGTAFFRQSQTGFETVDTARQSQYAKCLETDLIAYGAPSTRYVGGDSALFDQIGVVNSRWNRVVIFRGNCLHSSAIPNELELPDDPLNGRLTVVSFLIAE